jgi:hypothetical protein
MANRILMSAMCIAVLSFGACSSREPQLGVAEERVLYFPSSGAATAAWEKQAWIERVARLLRGGRGLDPRDPKESLPALMAHEKSEIIDILMSNPLFGDAVLDFNLYFLGAKRDLLRSDADHYASEIFDYPQSIASAKEVLADGDFLKLLDYRQPLFMGALTQAFSPNPDDQHLEPAVLRKKIFASIQGGVDELITWVQKNPQGARAEFCGKFNDIFNRQPGFFTSGIPIGLAFKVILSMDWYGKLQVACTPDNTEPVDLPATLQMVKRKNEVFFERLAAYEPSQYKMRDVRDVRVAELGDLVSSFDWNQFGFTQARTLLNSSTNYNRKRAAYVLKRFFCDDLTPIAVESPVEHAQDKHGSDPSCLACHYKLDPMAGFFRDFGIFFADFSKSKLITFDDQATMSRASYGDAWRAPVGSGREWNIGYVRSVNQPQLNDYGSSMEDLFGIIRKAPEVRQCVVRRMFEYFAGTDRMLDAGYLDSLAKDFSSNASRGSSAVAFKATVKRILLSNSFGQTNPVPGQCYDFAPGATPESSPPCAVAFVLQQNCVKCHASADTGFGNLDLAHWVKQSDGRYGFPYQDDTGKQRSRKVTFDALLDRLTTSDAKHRMPKGIFMPPLDREKLYLWVLQENGS